MFRVCRSNSKLLIVLNRALDTLGYFQLCHISNDKIYDSIPNNEKTQYLVPCSFHLYERILRYLTYPLNHSTFLYISLIYSISCLIINDVKSNWEMGNMNNICMNKNNWL